MATDNELDWSQSRLYVFDKLENIERCLTDVSRALMEFKSEVRIALATRNGVKKEDVDNMIAAAIRRRKDSGPLTTADLEKVTGELHKSIDAHITSDPATWAPWKYVLLGAAIAIPNILIEVVKLI
jgi:hypothetical protein